ncbi:MAG: PQQ-dependent sugar dehydrogenase [Bacteroidota bacterium]
MNIRSSSFFLKNLGLSLLLVGLMGACAPEVKEATQPAFPLSVDADNGLLELPDGFGAFVVADSLGRGRHIAVRDNGDIFLKLRRLQDGKGILALRDADQDGRIDQVEAFGDYVGTGMRIHEGYLYASSMLTVFRYKLDPDKLLPQLPPDTIASGFPEQNQHADKTLAFDQAGNMYVNVGAPSNACQEQMRTPGSMGLDPCPQLDLQAGIWKFSATQAGQTQQEHGQRYATGIRNAIALEWNPQTDGLYAMQHGRDGLHDLWKDLFDTKESAELPAEEFLQIDEGDDFGWPFCYYNQLEEKKMLAPEYGGDGQIQGRCEGIKPPIVGFPGHMAPNDLHFYQGDMFPAKYKHGAFIAFHGSWNRAPEPQAGYFVVFQPMADGKASGDWEVFAEGFTQADTILNPRKSAYRPVGLAEGPDGSLYVSDSQQGRIWRIVYQNQKLATIEE